MDGHGGCSHGSLRIRVLLLQQCHETILLFHMATATSPTRRVLTATPAEVAASLRHLPGFAWLDTAGCCPEADLESALSIIAARPEQLLRGHMSDTSTLEKAISGLPRDSFDLGLPTSGLIGSVSYDGNYCFGLYTDMLVYRHATREWFEHGDVLRHACVPMPERPWPGIDFRQDLSASAFHHMVEMAREYIAAGDIYQVNLAHRFHAAWPSGADGFQFYQRLREASPAPYAAYLKVDETEIMSSSPESFLRLSGNAARTRPIKGTRPRFADAVLDERSRHALVTSEKERSELIMITDLLRNDLGMFCEYGSVQVTGLLQPERYEQVHHMVSTIEGTLRSDISHVEALRLCLPGGSITGAPKKRAIEIIRELEPCPRGLYTGAIGFLGGNGESHFNIAIRTVTRIHDTVSFHVGAGIVGESDPAHEWEETLYKAAGILAAARRDS